MNEEPEPDDPPAEDDPAEDDPERDLPDKLFFRIGEAAQLIGVEPHVLRYWESEFQLSPQRSSRGQRLYRRADIVQFLRIRRLLHDEGFTIAGARRTMQDPTGSDPAAVVVESARISQAATRIANLRARIATVRARVRGSGVGAIAPKNDGETLDLGE